MPPCRQGHLQVCGLGDADQSFAVRAAAANFTHTYNEQPRDQTSTFVSIVQLLGTSNSSGARYVAVQCACEYTILYWLY